MDILAYSYEALSDRYQIPGYLFLFLSFLASVFLVQKFNLKYKLEVGILVFILLTGNLNELLTFGIPGISFFKIQPDRLLFLVYSYFLVRYFLFSTRTFGYGIRVPFFVIILTAWVASVVVSLFSHSGHIEISEVIVKSINALNFIVIALTLYLILDKPTLKVLIYAFIAGLLISNVFAIIQLGLDPAFFRLGDRRIAFGELLRSNGTFTHEYFNSYYSIVGIFWLLVYGNRKIISYLLVGIFLIGIATTFHRTSWAILALLLTIYFAFIERIQFKAVLTTAVLGLTILLGFSIPYFSQITESRFFTERLSEKPESRLGYYNMVFDNIHKKPVFGYGNADNDVYYYSMLEITNTLARATGKEGSIHNGYLEVLFMHGVPSLCFFVLFLILMTIYFASHIRINKLNTIAFVTAIIFILSNVTNTFLFGTPMSVLISMHLGIGLAIVYKWSDLDEKTPQKAHRYLQYA